MPAASALRLRENKRLRATRMMISPNRQQARSDSAEPAFFHIKTSAGEAPLVDPRAGVPSSGLALYKAA